MEKRILFTAGTKFGCDYLAYEKPPGVDHSKFMVICMDSSSDSIKPLDLISISRVSSQVKKKLLLAIVSPGNTLPYYIKANWWKGHK
uniref:tRNA-intron lyase n=1 Tax=Ditylenchus dipsaci TaxID=166011 RepID=A0A915D5E3_9BILA